MSPAKIFSRTLLNAGLACTAFACSGPAQDFGPEYLSDDELGTSQQDIYAATNTLWPALRNDTRTEISVCFENVSSTAPEVGWVRAAVEATWEQASYVDFVGFGACGSAGADIPIRVEDTTDGPRVYGLGSDLSRMYLNFSFQNWSTSCQSTRQFCIEAIAIHEFGHALGLAHEQNRPDSTCTEQQQGSNGGLFFEYDPNSTMNYCEPHRTTLSARDEAGIKRLYGHGSQYVQPGLAYALASERGGYMRVLSGSPRAVIPTLAFSAAIGTNVGASGSGARSFTLEPVVAGSTLRFGDSIRLKGAGSNLPSYVSVVVTSGRYGTSVIDVSASATPTSWTLTRTDGSVTPGELNVREPFALRATAAGNTYYLAREVTVRTGSPAGAPSLLRNPGLSTEWRFLGQM